MPTAGHNDIRNLEAGSLLVGVGAVLLFISLFLEWYQPRIDAWEIFEVWDLVLAVLAVGALVAIAGRMGFGRQRPASHVTVPAIAALVIVLYAFFDPPPLTSGIDGDPGTGLWLALAATVLMTAGALLSVARVSVAFTRDPVAEPAVAAPGAPSPLAGDPRAGTVADPAPGGPFAPRAGAVDPAASPHPGRRFMRDAPPAAADPAAPAVPPTEPTRRI